MPAFRPTRPRFRAVCTTSPSLAAGPQLIPWSAIDYDDVSGYNGAGGYVCDRDGLWLVTAHVSRPTVATAAQPRVECRLAGAVVSQSRGITRTEGMGVQFSDVIEAGAGALFELRVSLHSSVSVVLNDDARWSIARIGPKTWNF